MFSSHRRKCRPSDQLYTAKEQWFVVNVYVKLSITVYKRVVEGMHGEDKSHDGTRRQQNASSPIARTANRCTSSGRAVSPHAKFSGFTMGDTEELRNAIGLAPNWHQQARRSEGHARIASVSFGERAIGEAPT